MKIWALGDAVVDLLPLGNQQYEACAGGAPANVAVGAARLGASSGFIGRIGDDPFGRFMQQALEENGVDCRLVELDPLHRTSTTLVSLDESGERSFTFLVNPAADRFLELRRLPSEEACLLHTCSLALVGEPCRDAVWALTAQAKAQQGAVSFDVNLRSQMWDDKAAMRQSIVDYAFQADVLKLSEDELFWLTSVAEGEWEKALKAVSDYPAELKVITCGGEGGVVLWRGEAFRFNAYEVVCIDTTGAGDAFMAGLLSGIAQSGFPQNKEALRALINRASACGALATTQKGAWSALPTALQLREFLSLSSTFHMESADELWDD